MSRPWPQDAKYLQVGDVCLDLRYRHVLRDGESIELQQRIFDLLLLFIAEPHKLHTRAELFDRLWAGLIVDDANLSQNVWLLRKALGESRKQWVRTVAKGGYVFEAPGPVTWSNELPVAAPPATAALAPAPAVAMPADAASQDAATPSGQDLPLSPTAEASTATETASAAPSPHEPPPQSSGRRGWMPWAAAALLLAAVAVALILWRNAADRPTPEKPLAVALIPLQDSADTLRWPAKLLQDWLGWKLGSLPEVDLLSETDLAAGANQQSPVVVFLTSGRAPGADGQVVVRARLEGAGKEQRLEATGPLAQVPAMVDRLSRQIIARLDSPRAKPWPSLDIAAPAAERYVQAVEATDRRDWMAVSTIGSDVVRQAPRFGLARLRLAQAQSRLAQASAAKEQLEAARGSLRPVPDDVKTLLDAQILAVDPDRFGEAAKAFGAIAARYPAKREYKLEYARLLVAAGRPSEALPLLQADLMQSSPVGVRITRHLIMASAAGTMTDTDLMRLHARAAENLARVAGRGWELERAQALVALGRADLRQSPEHRDPRWFAEAARQFERAGNTTGALHAQFLAETSGPPVSGPNPRLDTLLAKARAGGYRGLEIEILTAVANQQLQFGDRAGYSDWLRQAWTVAQDSGDIASRNRIDLALAFAEFFDLRLSDVDARLARLKRADPEGATGREAYVLQATVDQLRGNLPGALDALTRSAGKLPAWSPGQPVPYGVAASACDRVELRIAGGELDAARKDLALCKEVKRLVGRWRQLMYTVAIEWSAGNRAEAERAAAQLRALPPLVGGIDDWGSQLELAETLTLVGQTAEAKRLLEKVEAELPAQGFGTLQAVLAMDQTLNATARGDWTAARRRLEEARRRLPPDIWAYSSRLDMADAVLALAAGDRSRAIALASAVHKQAHERGQVLVELQMHSLFPPGVMSDDCSAARRQALMARTGMRGASLDWLTRGLHSEKAPGPDIRTRAAANTDISLPPEPAGR